MSVVMVECANPKCDIVFERKRHNQKYHDEACCREATNDKLKQKYHERKARRAGKLRICKTPGCGTVLSKYNPGDVCGKCEAEHEKERKALLRRLFGDGLG